MSAFRDFVDAIRDAFSGGSRSSEPSGGSDRAPSSSPKPKQKPSILSRSTDDGTTERVATRDMPQFGIEAGQRTTEPDYGGFSLRGLFSTDPANVMRNIQAAERNLAAFPPSDDDDDNRPAPAPAPEEPVEEAPPPPPPPPPPVETESGLTPAQEERIERAGEEAAKKQSELGRSQTIATSPRGIDSTIATTPGGLLVSGGSTRRRRSLIGGGMIR